MTLGAKSKDVLVASATITTTTLSKITTHIDITKTAEVILPPKKLHNCIINQLLNQLITKSTTTATEQRIIQWSEQQQTTRKKAENKHVN